MRYHVLFVKKWWRLLDDMHYLPDFKPKFLQPMSTVEGEPDAVMDAVSQESFAVKEISTEVPAA